MIEFTSDEIDTLIEWAEAAYLNDKFEGAFGKMENGLLEKLYQLWEEMNK